jgi:hypothetical protein
VPLAMQPPAIAHATPDQCAPRRRRSQDWTCDIKLTLVDSSDTVLASDDPPFAMIDTYTASGLSAAISTTVPAGDYAIVVDGVGFGDPLDYYSDYDGRGAYTLSGTYVPTGSVPVASASGFTVTEGNGGDTIKNVLVRLSTSSASP